MTMTASQQHVTRKIKQILAKETTADEALQEILEAQPGNHLAENGAFKRAKKRKIVTRSEALPDDFCRKCRAKVGQPHAGDCGTPRKRRTLAEEAPPQNPPLKKRGKRERKPTPQVEMQNDVTLKKAAKAAKRRPQVRNQKGASSNEAKAGRKVIREYLRASMYYHWLKPQLADDGKPHEFAELERVLARIKVLEDKWLDGALEATYRGLRV